MPILDRKSFNGERNHLAANSLFLERIKVNQYETKDREGETKRNKFF